VIFTCTLSESPTLAWGSDHYVSDNGLQLFFGADDTGGLLKSSPNNASIANLTMVNGLTLESQLLIVVSADYARSTVTCFNNVGVNASICFDVMGENSIFLRVRCSHSIYSLLFVTQHARVYYCYVTPWMCSSTSMVSHDSTLWLNEICMKHYTISLILHGK
jgi:hypothetical protein